MATYEMHNARCTMHNAGRRSLAEALEAAPATSTWARIWLALLIVGDSGRDIQERAFKFACAVIGFCDTADDRRRTTERLLLQLFAAGTSIGANLAEASAGQTKPDFIAKTCVSLKEAREARYWLLLIVATRGALQPAAQPLLEEARELVKILTTIVKNARSNPYRG